MRAWAEMFNDFLAGSTSPAPTRRRTPTPTTSRTSTASPATTACATCSRSRGILLPEGVPSDPPTRRRCAAWATARTTPSTSCSSATASTPYPGSVRLLDVLREHGDAARGRVVVGQRPRGARRCRARPTASSPSSTAGSRPSSGCPASRPPTRSCTRPRELRHHPGPLGRRRGRRLGRAGRAPPAASGSSSASTAGPVPTRSPRPARDLVVADLASDLGAKPRQASTRDPLDRGRFPVDPWRLVECDPDRSDLGVTETLFTVANGYIGMRGNPEEGRARVRARHLHQRAPRDLADPARRGGLRLRPHRPDDRQRSRRQADEALRRRRAARHRHRRPRALRARAWTSATACCAAAACGVRRRASGSGSTPPGWSR